MLGSWAFRDLDVMVDRRVLIPRPETEQLVEVALGLLQGHGSAPLIVDLGTGAGVIALAMAAEVADARVLATDASDEALQVAGANLAGMGRAATRVTLHQGSWWSALSPELRGEIDLAVSNPPYVAEAAPLPDEVRDWEPAMALFSGADGLDAIRIIVEGAGAWLRPGGALAVEIGEDQGSEAHRLALQAGLAGVEIRRDLAGRDRFLVARREGAR